MLTIIRNCAPICRSCRRPLSQERDRYLGEELAEPDHDDVPNLDRVERLPHASRWVPGGKDHAGLLPALASIDSRKVTITSRRELGMAQVYRMLRVAPSDEGVLGV